MVVTPGGPRGDLHPGSDSPTQLPHSHQCTWTGGRRPFLCGKVGGEKAAVKRHPRSVTVPRKDPTFKLFQGNPKKFKLLFPGDLVG